MLSYKESEYFYFKGFKLGNKYASFKINTDGVLLAAWSSIPKDKCAVLDIGCGTGVISIIKALENKSIKVDAIDIDRLSYEETAYNVKHNDLETRIKCYHTALSDFSPGQRFNYIISNPPFYTTQQLPIDNRVALAKHTNGMSIQVLWKNITRLAAEECTVALIYPERDHKSHVDLALDQHFQPVKLCRIQGKEGGKYIRIMVEFKNFDAAEEVEETSMSIRAANGKDYSHIYIDLCRNYYLDESTK